MQWPNTNISRQPREEGGESRTCPTQFRLGLMCCLHSNSSTLSFQILPFHKKVMVMPDSCVVCGTGSTHNPVADHVCFAYGYMGSSSPSWDAADPGGFWVPELCHLKCFTNLLASSLKQLLLGTAHHIFKPVFQRQDTRSYFVLLWFGCPPLRGGAGSFAVIPPPTWLMFWYLWAKFPSMVLRLSSVLMFLSTVYVSDLDRKMHFPPPLLSLWLCMGDLKPGSQCMHTVSILPIRVGQSGDVLV